MMIGTLHKLARHVRCRSIVLNPLRKRALERFTDPQNVIEMATYSATHVVSSYYQVKSW